VIVVIGSPSVTVTESARRAAGPAVDVARAAVVAEGPVEIVGRVGEDAAGNDVLLDLASAGIGHVAILRDAGHATAETAPAGEPDASPFEDGEVAVTIPATGTAAISPVDAADVELALRYLPEYRVVVVVDPLDDAALGAAADAARWAGATLVVVVAAGAIPPAWLEPDATVLEAPAEDDGAFARFVGEYAARLDRGEPPADAFAAASGGVGWTAAGADA
jgi:sugar/nucleoside kinase (ribokinase family)